MAPPENGLGGPKSTRVPSREDWSLRLSEAHVHRPRTGSPWWLSPGGSNGKFLAWGLYRAISESCFYRFAVSGRSALGQCDQPFSGRERPESPADVEQAG